MMSKFARIAKRLVTVCATFMFTGAIVFRTILPLSQGDIITEQNVTIRPLACPSYLIFIDVQVTPIYEIYFTIQFVSGLITASIATGACGLTAIFVIHASGQMRILRDLMTTLVEEQKEYEVNKKLADIVEHQVRVRGFLRMVHHTLQEVFLMEMMVNTITLCIVMYFIIIKWQSNNTPGVCVYMLCVGNLVLHLFMYCYTGEQLIEQDNEFASSDLHWRVRHNHH
ncbi:odorant receptor 82a-like isoform X2 [Odontomachus brunneus]|uniref:odorant receptor 82a-like isoform X2 n=2 Tax=Odontomachus brunneus TaxID=486640 RepID=UPI0013F1F1C1|nr:odorant receptor 82a-like isoform X2 [Odontomachus brunneus]